MKTTHLLAALAAAALTACGGDGSSSPDPVTPPAAVTVAITGKAVDGPLLGAIACYDLNDNGACDSTEPTSAPTDADGNFRFDVAESEAGKHRVVVEVPASAVDKDTGAPVGTAFTLQSPATGAAGAQSVFTSPLTTLVQAHIDTTGATLSAATALVKTQAGLTLSPLADFTTATNADTKQAATVARLVQLTTLKQGEAVASVVGTVDVSGSAITKAQLDKAIISAVIGALPSVAAVAADPAVANATGAALQAALTAAAQTVVAQTGLTAESAAVAVGVAKLPPDTSTTPTPEAGGTLGALRYANANNWYYRTLESSAADNTPDANGKVRYYDVRKESVSGNYLPNAGVVNAWAQNSTRARAGDLHWNGSAWVSCTLGQRYTSAVRDAQGRSTYDYCDGMEFGASKRSAIDIAGKTIASVFTDTIRPFKGGINGGSGGVAYANWGPADLSVFGAATFPAGAKLFYQDNTTTATAFAYDVQATNAVTAFTAAVAAGGDARTATPACNDVTSANSATFLSPVTTLEDLAARNPGTPCIFNQGTNTDGASLVPNEWWSNATTSLGSVANLQTLPAGTTNYYSTTGLLRVAFGANNAAKFYQCLQRRVDGSTRNCTAIGTGTYAIQTLGDARVMTFAGSPAVTQKLGYTRVFIERGGKVWYGYQNPSGATTNYLRLNLTATNAIFKPLGIPPVNPVTRAADFSAAQTQTAATLKGAWGTATDTNALMFRFGDNGRFLMAQADAPQAQTREQTGSELGYISLDPSTGKYATLLEVDSNLTAGTSHPDAQSSLNVTATQITTGGGTVIPRLPSAATGIVGLWARGSATDLNTQHFAFFANGKVMMIDPLGDTSGGICTTNRVGPPGAEYASYTFDAVTGALRVFGKIYDTNGCAGFFDSAAAVPNTEANSVVTISADGKTLTSSGDTVTMYRIPSQ